MDHIRVIQEVVDAHKEDMPTGVTARVMEECQKAYNEMPELYKLTWTAVDSQAHVEHIMHNEDIARVKLSHMTQTLIVERRSMSCLTILVMPMVSLAICVRGACLTTA